MTWNILSIEKLIKFKQDVQILQLRYPNKLHFLEILTKDVQNDCENGITIHEVIFAILNFFGTGVHEHIYKKHGKSYEKVFEK